MTALGESRRLELVLGLDASHLLPSTPIQVGSTGNPFLYVPLKTPEGVDRAALDQAVYQRVMGDEPLVGIFLLALNPSAGHAHVYTRMRPGAATGILEDPATGSASGPLGAYLVQHGLVPAADEVQIVSEQGTKMGRQSFVHIRVRPADGRIEVGGQVVPVLEGRLTLPATQ